MNTQGIEETRSTEQAIELEYKYGAHNYKPLPVVLSKGRGIYVWDLEGKQYFDFLSAYSALNQGHCHPGLVEIMQEQASKLTLTSRAFHNDWLGKAEAFLAQTLNFDKVLMMNSGAEAVESALKLARRWAYQVKGVPEDKAKIIVAKDNFHGRTSGVISFSTDEQATKDFGPYMPGFIIVDFNDTVALENAMQDNNVCGFLVEPIQGEAGVIVPDAGYHREVRTLCDKYNVLFIGDEIQTGLGRTGNMNYLDEEGVKPDILTLGKALSGGMMPVSAVLANDEVMLTLGPGDHGSTFGGNPLAARLAIEAVKIILDEKLIENAAIRGEQFRNRMTDLNAPGIVEVRGKGLLNAVELDHDKLGMSAYDACVRMKDNGLLAKQTHGNIIRFTPPLIINQQQMDEACDIIAGVLS